MSPLTQALLLCALPSALTGCPPDPPAHLCLQTIMLSVLAGNAVAFAPPTMLSQSRLSQSRVSAVEMKQSTPVIIGVAADSGCGKSTFMRRLTSIFGGESKLLDIGRETNTLISDMTTVICLDDYHKWDREGRKSNPEFPNGITALDEKCQDWDKMAADVTDLKAGKTVSKPIYNHITGELDPYEEVPATPIVIFEGLHPLYDSRVNAALDLSIYLDITDDVKFAWKAPTHPLNTNPNPNPNPNPSPGPSRETPNLRLAPPPEPHPPPLDRSGAAQHCCLTLTQPWP